MIPVLFTTLWILGQSAPATEHPVPRWHLERDRVMSGGCVVFVFEAPRGSLPRDLTMTVPGRKPYRFFGNIGCVEYAETTLLMVWQNLDEWERIPGSPGKAKLRPVWDTPGEFRIHVTGRGLDWGEATVRVLPLEDQARPAVDLIYPVAGRGDQAPEKYEVSIAWAMAFPGEYEGAGTIRDAALTRLQGTLPIVCKHPDWARIAPAVVRHREFQKQYEILRRARIEKGSVNLDQRWRENMKKAMREIREARETSVFADAVRAIGLKRIRPIEAGYGPYKNLGLATQPATSAAE